MVAGLLGSLDFETHGQLLFIDLLFQSVVNLPLQTLSSGIPTEHMSEVMYSFGAVLFEYKNNSYKENEKYGYLLADGEIKKKYSDCKSEYMLNSLQKWIVSGDWNEKAFVKEITYRFGATERAPDQIFL